MFLHFLTAFLLSFSLSLKAQAERFTPEQSYPSVKIHNSGIHYIYPNELQPIQALDIFLNSPEGVYVSVGTERGFVGAALSNANSLLLVDHDPAVVHYNLYNTLMLKAAESIEHFRQLRSKNLDLLDIQELNLTSAEKSYLEELFQQYWWNKIFHGYKNSDQNLVNLLLGDQLKTYQGANYFFEEDLFSKLSQMAKSGQIRVEQGDFSVKADVEKINNWFRDQQKKISILDISNAWMESYMGREKTLELIHKTRVSSTDESIFMVVDRVQDQTRSVKSRYIGFRYSYFNQSLQEFERRFQSASPIELTGRLYGFDFKEGLVLTPAKPPKSKIQSCLSLLSPPKFLFRHRPAF